MKRLTALALAILLVLSLCACGSKQPEVVEVINEIEKIVEVEVPVEVEKIVEVPVEVEKIVEVPVEVEKIVEVPVEVEKIVEIPVEVEKIVEVPVEIEKTVEVTVEVEKIVEVPVEVEKIVEVPVEVEKIVEVPVEVEKIVEVPVEVEKIVEVPVEHMNTTYNVIPQTYTARELIEMSGIEIPADFEGDYEGSPVYLFYTDGTSPLRTSPEDLKTNVITYIYYYFETEINSDDPANVVSTRATVSHEAVSYGSYNGFSLVLWNGCFGWLKNTALSSNPMGPFNAYTVPAK